MGNNIGTVKEDLPFLNVRAIMAGSSSGRLHNILIDVDHTISDHIIPNEAALGNELLKDITVTINRILSCRKDNDLKLRIDPGDIGNECIDISSIALSITI